MNKPMSNSHFQMMSFSFRIRDLFAPRKKVLKEVGLKPGFQVLDFGCGPGSYVTPAAALVGDAGKVYALDIHPLAIDRIKKTIRARGMNNVETIQSDCRTGLSDNTIDVALLYDTLHEIDDPQAVLQELHRILKPGGLLSFSDHHMEEQEILSMLTQGGLFRLSHKGEKTYSFLRCEEPSKDQAHVQDRPR